MKLNLFFVAFSVLLQVQCFSENGKKNRGLEKALSDIAQSLITPRNSMLTLFKDKATISIPFASTAMVPHVVVKVPDSLRKFELTSSAIASLSSVTSVKSFNKGLLLTRTYSMTQQVIIHIRNATSAELKRMRHVEDA